MLPLIVEGLSLNKKEERFLNQLLKHDWEYPVASNNRLYRKGKANEVRLKGIAENEGGNHLILFTRVERAKRNIVLS